MDKNISLVYRILKQYPRYIVYSIYRIISDDDGCEIEKKFIYNSTQLPKECIEDE